MRQSGHCDCRKKAWFTAVLIAVFLIRLPCSGLAAPVRLPQPAEYAAVLREYLATLKEEDFVIGPASIAFDPAWIATDEDLHRLWILGQEFPATRGLRTAPELFVLSAIERLEGIMMTTGRGRFIAPDATAWWAQWNYPGNPYYNSRAVRNRAFVAAAIDMIMLDDWHNQSAGRPTRRADFLGGTLIWLAYTFHVVHDDLPVTVQEAYARGLARLVNRMYAWEPDGRNENINTLGLIGLWYAIPYIEDAAFEARAAAVADRFEKPFNEAPAPYVGLKGAAGRAREHAKRIVQRSINPAGMVRDAGGLEPSYNGIALYFMTWAALATDWTFVSEMQARMSVLKAHLTLPEPDGRTFFGPGHFGTRTSADPANDQWSAGIVRDMAAAMLSDEALYLAFGGRTGRATNHGIPDPETMTADIRHAWARMNEELARRSANRPTAWREQHWIAGMNFAYDHYKPGFYERLNALTDAAAPLTKPPFDRDQSFIHNFNDVFLVARFPEYGAILYTGRLGWHRYFNFGGGALSAFWTPDSGSVLLGRNGAPQHPHQNWESWRLWPSHALAGQTADGRAFSSARIRRRMLDVAYHVESEQATVIVSGPIGAAHDDGRATQGKAIHGTVGYRRRFVVQADGLMIESELASDGQDQVAELFESIPVFLGETRRGINQGRVLRPDGDGWTALENEWQTGIPAARIVRGNGATTIVFDRPRRIRLAPEEWTDNFQSRARVHNLHIDLLDGATVPCALPSVKVSYWIRPVTD